MLRAGLLRCGLVRGPLLVLLVLLVALLAFCGVAMAGSVGWVVRDVPQPSSFASADGVACEVEAKCDRYQLLMLNAGDEASHGEVTVSDKLPVGLKVIEVNAGKFNRHTGTQWNCEVTEGGTRVTCSAPESEEPVEPGEFESVGAGRFAPAIVVVVSAPTPGMSGVLTNEVTVEGGGAGAPVTADEQVPVGEAAVFRVRGFAFEAGMAGGAPLLEAGGHPWETTSSFGVPVIDSAPQGAGAAQKFSPVGNIEDVAVELPVGMVGDPLATARCPQSALRTNKKCPADTQVGVVGVLNGVGSANDGQFTFSGDESAFETVSPVYNMVPQAGYPAEFGFTFSKTVPVLLYANLVHTATGYRVRVTAPGVPATEETLASTLTFFGEPGVLNGSGSEAAFLSNPSDCSAEAEGLSSGVSGTAKADASRIELEAWGEPGHVVSEESTVYPSLNDCAGLPFHPKFSFAPSPAGSGVLQEGSTQADTPSAYTAELELAQSELYSELSTPGLRDATVVLAPGVTVDPPAGEGLEACPWEGPHGINIGSSKIGPGDRDEGDPFATELGAGDAGPGGNSSPYDDGFYHAAPGDCPAASAVGTAEVFTPLLPTVCGGKEQEPCKAGESPAPLQGKVFVAEPKCGEGGQPECREVSGENGELFGIYLEVKEAKGFGSIVKLQGTLSANTQTGQLTAHVLENPQFPFSLVRLHMRGGAKAPLANPQTCGSFAAASTLSSWAGQSVSATSSPFSITGCGASMPFTPAFTAGTVSAAAGAFSPFTVTFSRQPGEQDFAGITQTIPTGLAAMLSSVPLCSEPQAGKGECSAASQIGTTTDVAGAGSEPLVREGQVYLTRGYGGAPFGLSIVVPANAGPFHLGNVVVRAKIAINPHTAAATITSDPLPQAKDGVPFRLRTVNVNINRPGFFFNATNCEPQKITATITATQGASANVSSPYQATGCQGLPFHPSFSESTQGVTSKLGGASLTVKITAGPGEANIHKTDVQIPRALPSRLTTLQKACLEAQFNANPAGCPEGSLVGTATAATPVLSEPLTGPAYLVARGTEFPDLEFVLQGEGVTIILDGSTDIKKGITYSDFETVPDDPISSFQAVFPEGPHSALAANTNLCKPTETATVTEHVKRRVHGHLRHVTVRVKKAIPITLTSPTTLVGQNGAIVKQTTKITVTGCPTTKPATPKPTPKKKKNKK
jgi:hypothetical protein